ncbi:MAG: purine-binding chemotaxis protein CheW [Polyangiaceae bacterium]|nr:purine-binding chemotaxis protein CheW [Polyangiaceae bacterium]
MSGAIQHAQRRGDRAKNLVGFHVGDVFYAVQILRVREIINPLQTVRLPQSPKVIVGVADHRGEVVPVLDLRTRFGLERVANTRRTKWVIVGVNGRSVGLVVDAVTDVFGTGPESERAVPQLGSGDEARGIASVYMYERQLVFVIDVDRVASAAEEIDVELAAQILGGATK